MTGCGPQMNPKVEGLNYEISLFHDTFYFNKLQFRNHKREGGKSTHFLKAVFKTNSEIIVLRPYLWGHL